MKWTGYVVALLGLAATIYLIAHIGYADVLHSIELAGWGLLLLLPLHVVPVVLDSSGWRVLLAPYDRQRRAPLWFLLWVAGVREAVGRLLPVSTVGGDLVGVRLLDQRGVAGAAAAASVAVEIVISLISQYLLTAVAFVLLVVLTQTSEVASTLLIGLALAFPALAVTALVLRNARLFERVIHWAKRLLGDVSFLPSEDSAADLDAYAHELLSDPLRMARTLAWQFAGMLAGSLEIWLAMYLIGQPVNLSAAIVLEGLIQGIRYIAFFVPSGLGIQEAGFVFVGRLLGIPDEAALSLSLIRRLRELAFGLPLLASWQYAELRYAQRPNAAN